jgi:hypothetical protein
LGVLQRNGGRHALGGLIGLGGAEFRLPILISLFGFPALEAVILNKAMSLVVVATALPFRAAAVPFDVIGSHWVTIVNLLAGSLAGAWIGASWATRLSSQALYRTIVEGLNGGTKPTKEEIETFEKVKIFIEAGGLNFDHPKIGQ